MSKLGERLVKLRKLYELTQEDFANKIGVKRLAIVKWEGGTKPQKENFDAILKAFPEVRREWLEKGEGPIYQINIPLVSEPIANYGTPTTAKDILLAYHTSMNIQINALAETQKKFTELVERLA